MFHAMRVLEVGVHALAKRLHIPDPITAAQRNWAMMLREIQGKIDGNWPRKERIPLSEGSQYESVYVTLDSVRNPWRNATMHVETIYAPHEVIHIINCVHFFMQKLALLCDEEGNDAI